MAISESAVALATGARDKLLELCRFLDGEAKTQLEPQLAAILDAVRHQSSESAEALSDFLTRAGPPVPATATASAGEPQAQSQSQSHSRATNSARKRARSVSVPSPSTSRSSDSSPSIEDANEPAAPERRAKRSRTTPERFAMLPAVQAGPRPAAPKAAVTDKQEKKVQRLMQQCTKLKQRAETAEHSLNVTLADQREQRHKSKDHERAAMLAKVERICELSRSAQQHHSSIDSAVSSSKQELIDDQHTLAETWEWLNSPQHTRESAQSMQTAQAIAQYNRHAAFGRKMSLRERYICGVLAARFWDGTNPSRARQEREQVDAKTASNFEKWCSAGHLHTSMRVSGAFVPSEPHSPHVLKLSTDVFVIAGDAGGNPIRVGLRSVPWHFVAGGIGIPLELVRRALGELARRIQASSVETPASAVAGGPSVFSV